MENEIGGEEAVELFQLAKQKGMLPTNIDELVPLSFIGQAAVSFYRQKIKLMNQLKMTEAQRKVTLSDGQDAGEMLLDIETRIGELAKKEPSLSSETRFKKGERGSGALPTGKPPKYERLGIPQKRMHQAQVISKHPEIVERVKAKARANEDIPTKTAVLAEIRLDKELKKKREKKKLAKKTPPIDDVVDNISKLMADLEHELRRVKKYIPQYIERKRVKQTFYLQGKSLAELMQDIFLNRRMLNER